MPDSRLALRGGWAFQATEDGTIARRLNCPSEVELTGALHSALGAALTPSATQLLPEAFEAFEAFRKPADPITLGSLLRGSGWELLFVELTGRCNERCVHCYAGSSPEVDVELDWPTVKGVLDDAIRLGFSSLQFTGGDALLSPHLAAALRHARHVGYSRIEVATNGLALRSSLLKALQTYDASLSFSLYSHCAATHDAITGVKGSHQRTLNAIDAAVRADLKVRVATVLRSENHADVGPLRQLLQERGVPVERVGIDRERPVGRGNWNETVSLESERSIHTGIAAHRGTGKLSVLYDGRITPCIFDRDTVLGRLGDQDSLFATLERPIFPRRAPRRLDLAPMEVETGKQEQPLACTDCQARRTMLDQLLW